MRLPLAALLILLCSAPGARAQDESDLARKTQNPISDLISVPFEYTHGHDFARQDRSQNVLNIKPVYPMELEGDFNMITRTIMPLIYQPELTRSGRNSGFGDLQFTAWLTPKNSDVLWGLGPVALFPTASDDELGTGKISLGPSAVLVVMDGPWVLGGLAQNLFSVAGDGGRRGVNQMLIQPFINYNMGDGWYLVSTPLVTANWKADGPDVWTLPVGGGIGRVVHFGDSPINLRTQAFYNVAKPKVGPRWSLQFQVQLLFPK